MSDMYYIEDRSRACDTRLWWLPYERGYTCDLSKAGLYTRERARQICRDDDNVAWPEEFAKSHSIPVVLYQSSINPPPIEEP